MQLYLRNRRNVPEDELARYAGRYVAWSPDGTHIIAAADRLAELARAVESTEFDAEECVLSYVPAPDEVILGGAPG